jgi:hypothetical protein
MSLFKTLLRIGYSRIVIVIIATVIFFMGARYAYNNIVILSDAITTKAVLVTSNSFPTLEFVAQNGEKYQVKSNYRYKSLVKGDVVTIHYKVSNPNMFLQGPLLEIWIIPSILFGFSFLVFSLVVISLYREQIPKKNQIGSTLKAVS